MRNIMLPYDISELGELLPLAEAIPEQGDGALVAIYEQGVDEAVHAFKVVWWDAEHQKFVSQGGHHYDRHDPSLQGFLPIVQRGTEHGVLVRPRFQDGDLVRVRHQPDLGVCTVVKRCDPTDESFICGTVLNQHVGYYVRIDSEKRRGLGYHEESLELAHAEGELVLRRGAPGRRLTGL